MVVHITVQRHMCLCDLDIIFYSISKHSIPRSFLLTIMQGDGSDGSDLSQNTEKLMSAMGYASST